MSCFLTDEPVLLLIVVGGCGKFSAGSARMGVPALEHEKWQVDEVVSFALVSLLVII